ncbi:MAG: ABC transporter substrate-binding protein [Promethearchaeota archaeon]
MREEIIRKQKLKIGHLSTAYHSNFIIMGSDDLEQDLQIPISWHLFGTGPEMMDAFRKGELDAGYIGLTPAAIGIAHGIPIQCVAGGHVEGTVMTGLKKYQGIQDFSGDLYSVFNQFIGKTIGVTSKGSIHEVILNYYLDRFELKDKIKIQYYSQAEYIALDLKKGIIEGGVGTPSLAIFASTILDSHLIIPPKYLWKYNPSYGVFFHEEIIQNYPFLVNAFLKLHKQACYMLRNDRERAAELISNSFKILDKAHIMRILNVSPKYCIALPEEFIASTMKLVKVLKILGYMNKELKLEDIFNFSFMEEVHPEEAHYDQMT